MLDIRGFPGSSVDELPQVSGNPDSAVPVMAPSTLLNRHSIVAAASEYDHTSDKGRNGACTECETEIFNSGPLCMTCYQKQCDKYDKIKNEQAKPAITAFTATAAASTYSINLPAYCGQRCPKCNVLDARCDGDSLCAKCNYQAVKERNAINRAYLDTPL